MPKWKFTLVNSKDLSKIGDLRNASSRSVAIALNNPGSASYQISMRDRLAEFIEPYETGIIARRFNYRASVAAGRAIWDDIWSGYTYGPVAEDWTNERMTIQCVGWLNRLEHRMLRRDLNFVYVPGADPPTTATATDDADIIYALVDEMNLTTAPDGYAIPIVVGSDPAYPLWFGKGSKLPNEGAGGATPYVPAMRGKNYQKYTKNILAQVQELINTENGCDIDLDPISRLLNIHRKKMVDRPGLLFGWNRLPRNVMLAGREIDPSVDVNYMLATGKPGTTPKFAHDTTRQAEIGILEDVANLSDVTEPANQTGGGSVLGTYAGAELLARTGGRQTFQIQPIPYSPGGPVPEPFVDYTVGDRLRYNAYVPPRVDIRRMPVRVFGFNVNIDDEDNEKLQALTLSPS